MKKKKLVKPRRRGNAIGVNYYANGECTGSNGFLCIHLNKVKGCG